MKYLGIDVGTKRVGLSVSDDSGIVAFPLGVVSRAECIEHITALLAERGIDTVVIGESVDLDGMDNPVMDDVRAIAEALGKHVPVVLQPEQFSSQAALQLGGSTDAEAATVILQRYLEHLISDEDIAFE